jgi:hypothetical protein
MHEGYSRLALLMEWPDQTPAHLLLFFILTWSRSSFLMTRMLILPLLVLIRLTSAPIHHMQVPLYVRSGAFLVFVRKKRRKQHKNHNRILFFSPVSFPQVPQFSINDSDLIRKGILNSGVRSSLVPFFLSFQKKYQQHSKQVPAKRKERSNRVNQPVLILVPELTFCCRRRLNCKRRRLHTHALQPLLLSGRAVSVSDCATRCVKRID